MGSTKRMSTKINDWIRYRLQCLLTLALLALLLLTGCDSGTDLADTTINVPTIQASKIPSQPAYVDMYLSERGQRLYIADSANNRVHIFRTSDDTYMDFISLDSAPTTLAANENESALFVTLEGTNEIRVISLVDDLNTQQVVPLSAPATSLAVGDNHRLYVGIAAQVIPEIKVFDISVPDSVVELDPLPTEHGYVVGISNNRAILMTSEYGKNSPMVSSWDIAELPVVENSNELFGVTGPDNLPGTIVFQPDDRYFYVLTEGTASYDARLPVYQTDNFIMVTDPDQDFYVDYTPSAIAFNASGDRVLIAHAKDAANSTDRLRHLKSSNDIHMFDTTTKREIGSGPVFSNAIVKNGIAVSTTNKVYLLLGETTASDFAVLAF